jgi:hypothetical protein
MQLAQVLSERRKSVRHILRERPPRPAYLDYPYTSPEPAFSFWDDNRQYVWGLVIAAIVAFGGYWIYDSARHFTLFDTLC